MSRSNGDVDDDNDDGAGGVLGTLMTGLNEPSGGNGYRYTIISNHHPNGAPRSVPLNQCRCTKFAPPAGIGFQY